MSDDTKSPEEKQFNDEQENHNLEASATHSTGNTESVPDASSTLPIEDSVQREFTSLLEEEGEEAELNESGEKVASSNKNYSRYIIIGVIALTFLVGASAYLLKSHSTSTSTGLPILASKTDGQGIELNPKAKIKVDFYEDFRCPNCRNFEAINNSYINKIIASGQINAVFHPMSFIASDSLLAASASACASDQGYYLKMHTALYAYQPSPYKVSERTPYWTEKTLIALGHSLGITSSRYDSCINVGQYINWANGTNTYAATQNVNGTPTVIVNGKMVPLATDYSASAFQKLFANLGVK